MIFDRLTEYRGRNVGDKEHIINSQYAQDVQVQEEQHHQPVGVPFRRFFHDVILIVLFAGVLIIRFGHVDDLLFN